MVYLFDCGCFWFTPESSFIFAYSWWEEHCIFVILWDVCCKTCKNGHRPIQRRVKIQKKSSFHISFASSTPQPLEFSFLQQESLYGCGRENPAKEQDLPFTATQLCATTWHTQPDNLRRTQLQHCPLMLQGSSKNSKIVHKCSRAPPKGLQLSPRAVHLCEDLNQINFTGELNFRRGHRKVRIGITKEGGLKRG